MSKVQKLEPQDRFTIWLSFDDGVEGVVDLGDLAGKGVFAQWTDDPASFQKVHVDEAGAAVWEGGLALCPDSLYLRLTGNLPFANKQASPSPGNA